ncbi:unnamed protein product [Rotaria sp. Silwood1]|nr:unnamed protein product [Rotaria sp. Silwood1]
MSSTIIYTALLSRTINDTVYNPSESKFREIYEKYPNTYTCPCSHVSVQYNQFAYFQITFHEVCKSEFISQEWIDTTYSANVSFIPPNDIRTILSHFWIFVRSFCALANVNVIDASNQFNSTNLVSRFAQPQHLIETKANATLALALNSTLNNLKRNLLLTREIILSNGLLSILATNYFFYISFAEQSPFDSSILVGINATSFPDGCSCEKSNGCSRSAVIFESNATSHSVKVPGMMFDCLPLDGALASSLECFYDSSCLTLIQNVSLTNMRPSLLSNHSRFKHNTTLMTLVDELMIEELIMTVVFSSYYSICNPKYCTYSYTHKFNILFMITFTTGAFGGVSTLLSLTTQTMTITLINPSQNEYEKLWNIHSDTIYCPCSQIAVQYSDFIEIVPSILNKIFRLVLPSLIQLALIIWNRIRKQDSSVNQSASIVEVTQRNVPTISYRIRIQEYIRTLNLFQTESSTNDTRRQEILSTRLYLGLVIGFTMILFLYTGLIERTTTIMVPTPSISTYVSLQERYSDTLQCPCSTISIPYQEFIIYLNATFHPICSRSDFLSAWYNYFYRYRTTIIYWIHSDDFRSWAIVFFNFLEKYCEQATITAADAIEQFKSDLFVSSEAMFPILFKTQIEMKLILFQKSTSILFARQLQMFRNISVGHGLISNLGINIELKLDQIAVDAPVLVIPKTYKNGTCSCATSSNCVELASFYNLTHDIVYTIENIYTGCFMLESILHSSLTCFFSNSCMIDLMSATNLGNPNPAALTEIMDISPLEFASPIPNFNINDTIETMVYQLFIDSWSNETSYERYYNACTPIKCIYLKEKRLNVIYAVTIFLTVINGLLLGLRSVAPLFVRLFHKLGNRIRGLCS